METTKPTKRCPYCNEEILAVAKKCKYCGEWLNKEKDSEQVAARTNDKTEPVSQQTIQPKIDKPVSEPDGMKKGAKSNKTLIIVIAAVGVAALAVGGYFLVNHLMSSKSEKDSKESVIEMETINKDVTGSPEKYVIINANELRLRYGPSLDSQTLKWSDGTERYAVRGEKFKYLDETDEFYKIDYNGGEYWVFKKYANLFEEKQ